MNCFYINYNDQHDSHSWCLKFKKIKNNETFLFDCCDCLLGKLNVQSVSKLYLFFNTLIIALNKASLQQYDRSMKVKCNTYWEDYHKNDIQSLKGTDQTGNEKKGKGGEDPLAYNKLHKLKTYYKLIILTLL